MKRFLILVLSAAIAIVIIPLSSLKDNVSASLSKDRPTENKVESQNTQPESENNKTETITVFLSSQNQNVEMDMFEYLCGSVAAEMPLAYHEEALKAQAVTCYTNALRLKNNQSNPYEAHISDNTAVHQGYINEAQRREKWGDDFEKWETKLKNVVKSIEGKAIYYNEQLIVAAFFAISCGKTESSETLWGESVPYLVSVDSSGDFLSPQHTTISTFSKENYTECLTNAGIEYSPETLLNSIKISETSPTGTVLKAEINGKNFTGEEIRTIFALRSPVFTISTTENDITFTVLGYGHGIGMSQYGADYLARQGYSFEDILSHYYTGVTIK